MRRKARPSAQPWMKQECDLDVGPWDNGNSGTTSDAEQDNTLSSAVSSKTQVYAGQGGCPPIPASVMPWWIWWIKGGMEMSIAESSLGVSAHNWDVCFYFNTLFK